jgi:hypothetical protein
MSFGINQSTNRTLNKTNNSSLLAQTLFNPQNQLVFEHTQSTPIIDTLINTSSLNDYTMSTNTIASGNHTKSQTTVTQPEAIILQTNGAVITDDILLQLQEQVGEGKQIYVLNTEDDDNVQYLIVDKDADISAILQDPSIFQSNGNTAIGIVQQQQPQAQQQQPQQQFIIVQNNPISVEQIINETSATSVVMPQAHHVAYNNQNTNKLLQNNNHYNNNKNTNSYNSQMQCKLFVCFFNLRISDRVIQHKK